MSENTKKDPYLEIFEGMKAGILAELPETEYEDTTLEEAWIEMSDGVRLYATICRPAAGGSYPAIIIRNPYVAAEAMYDVTIMPVMASHGYAAIYVRVRATVKSEGEWLPFENERRDGMEVLDWVSRQSWCNGNIGTYGASYVGHVQLCMADYDHPALKTMFVSVYGSKPYETFYRREMFREDPWTDWAYTMVGDNRHQPAFPKEMQERAFALRPKTDLGKEFSGEDCEWFNSWVRNTKPTDDYWNEGIWKAYNESISKIKIPIFFHGGWFDIFLRSQLATFRELPEETRAKSRMMIGPWTHGGSASAGALTFPNENKAGILYVKAAIEWFDHWLKGKEYEAPLGGIETYVIGEGDWIFWNRDIEPDEKKIFYFTTEGKAVGGLEAAAPVDDSKTEYIYDPKKPGGIRGGNVLGTARQADGREYCCMVQEEPGAREDAVSFLSVPLKEDLRLAGSIRANLYVSSTAPATAFAVSVMEIGADGRSINIRDDITDIRVRDERGVEEKYTPGEVVELELELLDCMWTLKAGSRLRIDISSSNFPAYHMHPNTEEAWADAVDTAVAAQTLYCGKTYPSRVELPLRK